MLSKKEPDFNSLLMMEDIMDILYRINRIKENSYDQNLNRQINNMPPTDRAQNIIKYISKNCDDVTRKNANILINILKNINEVSSNRNSRSIRSNRNNINNRNSKNYERNKSMSNSRNFTISDDNNVFEKIKNFLKLLNDE